MLLFCLKCFKDFLWLQDNDTTPCYSLWNPVSGLSLFLMGFCFFFFFYALAKWSYYSLIFSAPLSHTHVGIYTTIPSVWISLSTPKSYLYLDLSFRIVSHPPRKLPLNHSRLQPPPPQSQTCALSWVRYLCTRPFVVLSFLFCGALLTRVNLPQLFCSFYSYNIIQW